MRVPGFSAEAALSPSSRHYSAVHTRTISKAVVAPAQVSGRPPVTREQRCFGECVRECINYGLDTTANCYGGCFLGCFIAPIQS